MAARQLKEMAAMMLIGEGLIGALAPRRHMQLWDTGPKPLRRIAKFFAKRRGLSRSLAIAEAGLGGWLAWRQLRR